QQQCVIHQCDSTKDERAKAAGTNRGGNRGDADGKDRGSANAGEYHRKRQGKTHPEQDLPPGHAHGFGGFKNRRVDRGQTNVGVAQYRQQRVENQRDDRSAFADASNEGNGNQKSKQGQAGNRLQNAGDAKGQGAQSLVIYDEHPQRHADGDGDEHGDQHQSHVIQGRRKNFSTMLDEKVPGGHAGSPVPNGKQAAKDRTSGCSS